MNANRMFVRDLLLVSISLACVAMVAMVVARRFTPVPHAAQASERPAGTPRSLVALGAELYEKKGCVACHSVDGSARVGPTFLHDYGTTIALADGTTVAMDDAYIAESVLSPQARARPGYPPSMPSYGDFLKPRELAALTAYIRSLR